jgi:hypothetical protein
MTRTDNDTWDITESVGATAQTSSTLPPPLVHARPSRHMAIPTERAIGPVGCTIFGVQ